MEQPLSLSIKTDPDQDLVLFFDLLARFDFEDKRREKSVLNPDPLVSAPRESGLDPETIPN